MQVTLRELIKIDYDTKLFPFAEIAQRVLNVDDLSKIHERPDLREFGIMRLVEEIAVCRTAMSDSFANWAPIYERFVHEVLGEKFGGIVAYQTPPSFRFHFSERGNSSFHRDRDYGVQPGRLNAWIPLTPVWGENSIWIESEEGRQDFEPVSLEYGQVLVFDGANLCHGCKRNGTGASRVSFDLRFACRP